MEMLRVWPVICQFGVGTILFALGIWGGMKGNYLNLKVAEDRWLLAVLVGSSLLLLIFSCIFTFAAPDWGMGGAQ